MRDSYKCDVKCCKKKKRKNNSPINGVQRETRESGVIEYASISSERLFDFLWENTFMNKIQRIYLNPEESLLKRIHLYLRTFESIFVACCQEELYIYHRPI